MATLDARSVVGLTEVAGGAEGDEVLPSLAFITLKP